MAHAAVWYMQYAQPGWNETSQAVPTIDATGLILATQGCDKLLIPGWKGADKIEEAVASLEGPMARRVKVIDKRGSVLKRVLRFVEPLGIDESERGPPATQTFPNLAVPHLYQLALACKYGASVVGHDSHALLHKLIETDTVGMDSEAKYRLAQIASLITSYDAFQATRVSPSQEVSSQVLRNRFVEMLDTAEFEQIVSHSGYLGFVRNPVPGLRQLKRAVTNIIENPRFNPYAKAVTVGADILTGNPAASTLPDLMSGQRDADFSPPLLDLSYWDADIYRASLSSRGIRPTDPTRISLHVHKPIVCGQVTASISNRTHSEDQILRHHREVLGQARHSVGRIVGPNGV